MANTKTKRPFSVAELKYVTFLHEQIIREMSDSEFIRFMSRKRELRRESMKHNIDYLRLTKKF